jgi:hypothetical protein
MAIRNGAQQGTDYEVQQPLPLQGQYLASTSLAVTSIVLTVLGAAGMIYTLVVRAGTTIDVASILAVLAGTAVAGYSLYQGTARVQGLAGGGAGSHVYVAVTGRIAISSQETQNWPVTPNVGSRVVFYQSGTSTELAAGKVTVAEESEVELQAPTTIKGGPTTYIVDVKP